MRRTKTQALGRSIYRRRDGRYAMDLEVHQAAEDEPRRRRQTVYGRSPAEVEAKALAALERSRAGLSPGRPRGHLAERLSAHLESRKGLAWNSRRAYTGIIRHILEEVGDVPLSRLGAARYLQGAFDRLGKRFSAHYTSDMRVFLRAALEPLTGVAWPKNPAAGIALEPGERKPVTALTTPEARALRIYLQGHRFEAPMGLMLFCGLRLGEALGLAWSDVSLEAGTLRITQQLQDYPGERRLVDPKSDSSGVMLPMPMLASEMLGRWRLTQTALRLQAGARWRHSGLICTNRHGHPVGRTTIQAQCKRLCAEAGVRQVTPHGLRHSTATVLLEAGEHAKAVQVLMRHASYQITMDLYSHVSPELLRAAASKLDQALR